MDKIIWKPQAGPQLLAVSCPADIICYGGARGGGKTDCALGRQISGALKWGHAWNGLVLRKNYKYFKDLRRRVRELIMMGLPAILQGGEFQPNTLIFENNAMVTFTAVERVEMLDFFQGQQFTEITVEEGTQFPFFQGMIDKLISSLRSPHGIRCHLFVTANPGGSGHNQVKNIFKIGVKDGQIWQGTDGMTYAFIPSNVYDNLVLCHNDPMYVRRLESIKDQALRRAWLEGDWDVVAGGFFDDVWDQQKHVIQPFKPPKHWTRIRSYDHGSATPFSVGWWAISDGCIVEDLKRAFPLGSFIRYNEWYGCQKDVPNTGLRLESPIIAEGIKEREQRLDEHELYWDGIADPKIFAHDDGPSVAEKMAAKGVVWRKGDNDRKSGWDSFRNLLRGDGTTPMLYVTANCRDFIRTVPVLGRDETDWEDVDTDQEDHAADEARYAVMSRGRPAPRQSEIDAYNTARKPMALDPVLGF